MRNRQIYELTETRQRRKETIYSDYSSTNSLCFNLSQINQKDRHKYFEEINNIDAPFSHNMIISHQVLYRCLNGDFIQLCDLFLQQRNLSFLDAQTNNQNRVSLFINIKITNDEELLGIWLGKDIAQTYNIDVFFIQCYISDQLTNFDQQMVNLALFLSDELFITWTKQIQVLINLFQIIKCKLPSLTLTEIEKSQIHPNILNQLSEFTEQIKFVNTFPSQLFQFQCQYYDYQSQNHIHIPNKIWRGFQLKCNIIFYLINNTILYLQKYDKLTNNVYDLMYQISFIFSYNSSFQQQIDTIFDDVIIMYKEYLHHQIFPTLPNLQLKKIILEERIKIQSTLFDQAEQLIQLPYFQLQFSKFLEQIDKIEEEFIIFNNEIIECNSAKKLKDILKQISYFNFETIDEELILAQSYIICQQFFSIKKDQQNLSISQLVKEFKLLINSLISQFEFWMKKENQIEILTKMNEIKQEKLDSLINFIIILQKEIKYLKQMISEVTQINSFLKNKNQNYLLLRTQLDVLKIKESQLSLIFITTQKKEENKII